MVLDGERSVTTGIDNVVNPLVQQCRRIINPDTQVSQASLSVLKLTVLVIKLDSDSLHGKVKIVQCGLLSSKPIINNLQLVSQITLGFIDIC